MTYYTHEHQIEAAVECVMNGLDKSLMRGIISQATYDARVNALARWARTYREPSAPRNYVLVAYDTVQAVA